MAHKGSFRKMLPELFILFNILTRYGLIVKEKACVLAVYGVLGEGVEKRFTQRRGDAEGAEEGGGGRCSRGEPSPFGLG